MKKLFVILLIILFPCLVSAQTVVNGKASVVPTIILIAGNPIGPAISTATIKFQINTTRGGSQLGGSTIIIQFDTLSLSMKEHPVRGVDYFFQSFINNNLNYDTGTVTRPVKNQIWINIDLMNNNRGSVVARNPQWTDIVTVKFQRISSRKINVYWMTSTKFWKVYDGDNFSNWRGGKFQNILNY